MSADTSHVLNRQRSILPPAAVGQPRLLVPPRQDRLELLEQGFGTPEDVAVNLAEMARINRWLGGHRALVRHLYPLLEKISAKNEPLSLVDLGGGSGETAQGILQWARYKRINLKVLALDLEMRHLAFARSPTASSVHLLQGNALKLPFAANSINIFISSLLLHHLAPEQVIHLLHEAYRCARHGIVMTDLVRGYLSLTAFRFVQPIFARHPLTRHDGALSIRRAYTPDELLCLAHQAGLDHARVYAHFPWRMTLVVEKREASHA